jgi:hypothetical protein
MKIKLDENLPERIVAGLTALGHDTDSVPGEGLGGPPTTSSGRRSRRRRGF